MSQPVPEMLEITVSPICFRSVTIIFDSLRIILGTFFWGISPLVLTDKTGASGNLVFIIVVSEHTGALNSLLAYSIPFSHLCPEKICLLFSTSTLIRQPVKHMMQEICFT